MTKSANSEGSVYFRASKDAWVAAVTVFDKQTGQRHRRTRQAETKVKARALLRGLLVERDAGVRRRGAPATVKDLLNEWLDSVRDTVRPATFTSYEIAVRRHLVPQLGAYTATEIEAGDVRDALRRLSQPHSETARRLSPTTVLYALKCLRMAFALAGRQGEITRNVVAGVEAPRLARREVDPFTVAEVLRLLEAVRGHRYGALVALNVAVGLRISETLGLRWSDLDLEARTLRVQVQLARDETGFVLVEPKSAAGRRTVALPTFVADLLRAHRRRQLEDQLSAKDWSNKLDLAFTTERGAPLHRRNVLRWFQTALEHEGLPVRGLKELRHTAATVLHAQGASAKDVQETLGHSDVKVTLNTYTHLFEERKHEIAARTEAVYGRR